MNELKKIRIFVVEDSSFFRTTLVRHIDGHPRMEVAGQAVNAHEAAEMIPKVKPDVVSCDIEMPGINGIEFLKKFLPKYPVPVVLVSSLNINVFDALSAGAVDFLMKPDMTVSNNAQRFFEEYNRKIIAATYARVAIASVPTKAVAPNLLENLIDSPKLNNLYIAIGASTGGTEATLELLKGLPAHTPGIVIVQHMPPGFTNMYATRLNGICSMEVKEAKHGDAVKKGRVLIAPGDMHMRVVKIGGEFTVQCAHGERVSGHCPSVDVLFDSVAERMGSAAIGVIMTGMGRDGASGLLKMKKRGSYTIGQSKESCIVYGMPMVAKEMNAVDVELPVEKIAGAIKQRLNTMSR